MKIFQELHRTAEEAVFIAHNSLRLALHANVLNCESTSALLWQTLKHLHSALPQIISPVVQAALKYR